MILKTILSKLSVPAVVTVVSAAAIIGACSSPSSSTETKKNSNNAAVPTVQPLGTPQGGTISPSSSPAVPNQACWDQILKSPAALACTTLFAYSTQTCVSGLTKQATCTRDDINNVYVNMTVNGQPAMTQVDQWIAAGYTEMQCATGSDQKLYIYFLKKSFAPSTQGVGTYKFEEQTLGPPGAILDSIKLNPASTTGLPASCG